MPTTASDAFTAAIIVWQLLAGRHPFASALGDAAEPGDYRERVLAGRSDFGAAAPPFLDGVPASDSLRSLLMDALSPDPAKRPTVAALHAALLEARRGGETPRPRLIIRRPSPAAPAPTPPPTPTPTPTRTPTPTPTHHSSLTTHHSSLLTSTSRLALTGCAGAFSTGGDFAVTRTTLRRIVGDDARFAGDAPQFKVVREGGGWQLLPPPEPPRNPTFHNGAPLAGPAALAAGDTISIGPSKALCRVSFSG